MREIIRYPNRRSIRLPGYDYSTPGAYFITICTQNRDCRFGEILDGVMRLNPAGRMIEKCWMELPGRFETMQLDEFIVMPNHFQAAIFILDIQTGINATLSDMVRVFKSITTVQFIHGVNQFNWPRFDRQLWQRNFYDHIIRDEKGLDAIRKYIRNNPMNWELDRDHPAHDTW